MKPHTKKFIQRRKFLMVLPLLVMPFIAMIFWALGGGKGIDAPVSDATSGLNMEIPFAHFEKADEHWDKFSLYEEAKRDSIKYEEARKNDPYYVVGTIEVKAQQTPVDNSALNTSLGEKKKYSQIAQDEILINEKLELLTKEISRPEQTYPAVTATRQVAEPVNRSSMASPDVDRLERMMEMMASNESESNPEMEQMQDVLNKILDIQHPERTADKIREESIQHKAQVFAVEIATEEDDISVIEPADIVNDTTSYEIAIAEYGFFGIDDKPVEDQQSANAIEAVIHETQTVVTGSTIRLRLTSDVFINGQLIGQDQFVYGTCAINGDRLTIAVNSIQHANSLLPVALSVYDLDGIAGISIPGAITRDAAKQATSQSVQDLQLYSMNNSIGVQAATAGLEAAKGLFSKKAKLVKATVKAGHHILLKDNNQKAI